VNNLPGVVRVKKGKRVIKYNEQIGMKRSTAPDSSSLVLERRRRYAKSTKKILLSNKTKYRKSVEGIKRRRWRPQRKTSFGKIARQRRVLER